MPSNLPTAQTESNREARLAVLTSLAWLLLLPLGWFLTFSPLARQTLFRTVLGLAYLAVAFYKLLRWRSEEHTSELQSRFDLVCRLLLEKKKEIALYTYTHVAPAGG